MTDFKADWQLGTQWNVMLSTSIMACYNAMWEAHNNATHYDEWLRALEALRTLCIVPQKDCDKIDKEFAKIEQLMKREVIYSNDLDLSGDSKLRKKIDVALRLLQTLMIKILNDNNLIVKKSKEYDSDLSDFLQ